MKHTVFCLLFLFFATPESAFGQSKIKAKSLCTSVARQMAVTLNPLSADDIESHLIEWEYNSYTGEYELDIYFSWWATGCLLCEISFHEVQAYVSVNQYGTIIDFEPYEFNESVQRSASNSLMTQNLLELLSEEGKE